MSIIKGKETRLEIYKAALKSIKQYGLFNHGLCSIINRLRQMEGIPLFSIQQLPELWKQRPKERYWKGVYWYLRGSVAPRVKALRAAVKLVQAKIKPKK